MCKDLKSPPKAQDIVYHDEGLVRVLSVNEGQPIVDGRHSIWINYEYIAMRVADNKEYRYTNNGVWEILSPDDTAFGRKMIWRQPSLREVAAFRQKIANLPYADGYAPES